MPNRLDRTVVSDPNLSSRSEWLETNGLGGFASSTVAGIHTRRYHGLLVAALHPPVGRMVLLSKFEETLVVNGERFELSANRYPGTTYPQGFLFMKEFRRDPFPIWLFNAGGVEVEKSIFMIHGENATVVQYRLAGSKHEDCSLELRPLLAFRDYHSLAHENGALNANVMLEPGRAGCAPYAGCPELWLAHSGADVQTSGNWYRNFEYAIEQERGLDFQEDLFNPMVLTFDLSRDGRAEVIASLTRRDAADAGRLRAEEIARRESVLAAAPSSDPFTTALVEAADQYLVRRGEGSTIIAGYHWFSDWGRDTMIALPGLTLATGRFEVARGILLEFAASADQGMLPNRFPDAGGRPEYNSVDATLWFFEAVRALAEKSGDHDFVGTRLYSALVKIVEWHERGTRYGIRMDADGLLLAGEPGLQLTWMDAKVGDRVVTPRYGKPVEIQALWYNALRVMEDFAGRFSPPAASHYGAMAAHALASFREQFWNAAEGCLYDTVNGDRRDASLRPNQIFAVSLPHQMLTREQSASVVAAVERHLLTPYGLRSLATTDPQYRGRFEGGPASRDGAYHQGTVWPWLIGPFLTAYLRVNGDSRKARTQAQEWLAELGRYLQEEGMGQLPEVFDGDAPFRAGGCYAQAWSVAEVLRSLLEDRATAPVKCGVRTRVAD